MYDKRTKPVGKLIQVITCKDQRYSKTSTWQVRSRSRKATLSSSSFSRSFRSSTSIDWRSVCSSNIWRIFTASSHCDYTTSGNIHVPFTLHLQCNSVHFFIQTQLQVFNVCRLSLCLLLQVMHFHSLFTLCLNKKWHSCCLHTASRTKHPTSFLHSDHTAIQQVLVF